MVDNNLLLNISLSIYLIYWFAEMRSLIQLKSLAFYIFQFVELFD